MKVHLLLRREVYTLVQLREIYEDVRVDFRCTEEVKVRLKDTFGDKIMFSKIENSRSEYIFSSDNPKQFE